MKKLFLFLFLLPFMGCTQNSALDVLTVDKEKYIVSTDTSRSGVIKITYTPTKQVFEDIVSKILIINEELEKIEGELEALRNRKKFLLHQKDRLEFLRDSQ